MSAPLSSARLGATTEREIRSMPELWRGVVDRLDGEAGALAERLRADGPALYLGCGSGHLAGAAAAELLRDAGVEATAEVASDHVIRPRRYARAPGIALAISRSGETSETCAAAEAFRRRTGGMVVAVTCRAASLLGRLADRTIAIPEADEEAVAQTRSVSAFLLFSLLLAARVAGEDARDGVRAAADQVDERAPALWARLGVAAGAQRYVLLGGGLGHCLGREAALKFTEMGRVPAWAWRALEYRHGPLEALDGETAVVGPLGDRLDPAEHAAVREAAARAGQAVDPGALAGEHVLCQLYAVHALALLAARDRGVDADAPQQIRAFVDDVDLGDGAPR